VKYYKAPSDLSGLVYDSLEESIALDFPLQDVPTPLLKERLSHEAFQDSRASVYIGM
jgi:hypothetical protein